MNESLFEYSASSSPPFFSSLSSPPAVYGSQKETEMTRGVVGMG